MIPLFIRRQVLLHSMPSMTLYQQCLAVEKVEKVRERAVGAKRHRKILRDNIQGQFDPNIYCCCNSRPPQVLQSPLFVVLLAVMVSSIFLVSVVS